MAKMTSQSPGSCARAILLTLMAALLIPGFTARAQEGLPEEKPARETDYTLTFSKAFVQPGYEASVIVLFAQKAGTAPVRKVRARFPFPGKVLSYVRLEDAYLSRRAKLEMKAEQSAGKGDEQILDMTFELPAGGETPATTNFPSGQLATLIFKVSDPAADQVIRINPESWIDDQPVAPDSPKAQVEYGLVKVTQEPVIVGCFFFTH